LYSWFARISMSVCGVGIDPPTYGGA